MPFQLSEWSSGRASGWREGCQCSITGRSIAETHNRFHQNGCKRTHNDSNACRYSFFLTQISPPQCRWAQAAPHFPKFRKVPISMVRWRFFVVLKTQILEFSLKMTSFPRLTFALRLTFPIDRSTRKNYILNVGKLMPRRFKYRFFFKISKTILEGLGH